MPVVAMILIFVAIILMIFSYLKIERSTSGVIETLRTLRAEVASHTRDMGTTMRKIQTKMNSAGEKAENVVSRLDRFDKDVRSIATRLQSLEEPDASSEGDAGRKEES